MKISRRRNLSSFLDEKSLVTRHLEKLKRKATFLFKKHVFKLFGHATALGKRFFSFLATRTDPGIQGRSFKKRRQPRKRDDKILETRLVPSPKSEKSEA